MLKKLSRGLWNYRSVALIVFTPVLLLPLPLVIGTKVSLLYMVATRPEQRATSSSEVYESK